jgi:hypothetical protein
MTYESIIQELKIIRAAINMARDHYNQGRHDGQTYDAVVLGNGSLNHIEAQLESLIEGMEAAKIAATKRPIPVRTHY